MFTELNLTQILDLIQIEQTYEFRISEKKDRKKTIAKIEQIVAKHGITHTSREYARAIGNATKHGSYPVICYVYIGQYNQMICVVTDSGKGFDYKQTINKYKSGKVYYHHHGSGIRHFAVNKHLQVDWQDEGKTIILYYNGKQ